MAHIWDRPTPGEWRQRPLDQDAVALGDAVAHRDTTRFVPGTSSCQEREEKSAVGSGPGQELEPAADANVVLQRATIDGSQRWVLLCAALVRVRHNGTGVELGVTVLDDQDEILVHGAGVNHRYYFSSEQIAEIVPAPGGLSALCPRCKTEIEEGSPAVSCGTCGAWHHQRDDRPCWTYTDRCGACHEQETSLHGQLSWTPEQL